MGIKNMSGVWLRIGDRTVRVETAHAGVTDKEALAAASDELNSRFGLQLRYGKEPIEVIRNYPRGETRKWSVAVTNK